MSGRDSDDVRSAKEWLAELRHRSALGSVQADQGIGSQEDSPQREQGGQPSQRSDAKELEDTDEFHLMEQLLLEEQVKSERSGVKPVRRTVASPQAAPKNTPSATRESFFEWVLGHPQGADELHLRGREPLPGAGPDQQPGRDLR